MVPDKHYMDRQAELQWSMRFILLEWIVQVHEKLSLVPETLFFCVNYIDRFLSCKITSVGKLQLVGATAIFIAAKYEERSPPSVGDIVHMVDYGYTVDEILKAERFMLSMLQFELGWPGPMSFLRRTSKADNYDLKTRTLAKYFLEVTIMDERFIGTKPSIIVSAAYFLANVMVKNSGWVGVLLRSSHRRPADRLTDSCPCVLLRLYPVSARTTSYYDYWMLREFQETSPCRFSEIHQPQIPTCVKLR
jgi:G2/mitotic-specific cyclin 3/4